MKKLLTLALTCATTLLLASCNNGATSSNNRPSGFKQQIYMASNVKELPTMGHSIGGHMVVLKEKNELDIHYGMLAAGGSSGMRPQTTTTYHGTYTLQQEHLNLKYSRVKNGETTKIDEEYTIVDDYFRAQLLTEGGQHDDGTVEGNPGLNYHLFRGYELPQRKFIDSVYMCSNVLDDVAYRYILTLRVNNSFDFAYNIGSDIEGVINGTFKFKASEDSKGTKCVLTTQGSEYSFYDSNVKIGWDFKSQKLPSFEAVKVMEPEM